MLKFLAIGLLLAVCTGIYYLWLVGIFLGLFMGHPSYILCSISAKLFEMYLAQFKPRIKEYLRTNRPLFE